MPSLPPISAFEIAQVGLDVDTDDGLESEAERLLAGVRAEPEPRKNTATEAEFARGHARARFNFVL